MRVIIFGATGMVGQGVLRECLLDAGVERVLAVGRTATPQQEEKLHDLVVANFLDFSAVEGELSGYDACFFCLGITSAGMTEADYRRVGRSDRRRLAHQDGGIQAGRPQDAGDQDCNRDRECLRHQHGATTAAGSDVWQQLPLAGAGAHHFRIRL